MDCPYYEQLQYAGDTRIQALVSLYTAGDARLMKNAIAHLNDSRTAEGATMSRAPTRQQQYIPPFSLWWIGMVHDYYMYVDDPAFVREMLPGRPRGAAVLRGTTEGQRLARAAAVVELRGLDRRVAKRRAAAGRRRIERAARPAAAAGLRLGRAPRSGPGLEGDGRRVRGRGRDGCARRSGRSTGTRAGASSPTRRRRSSSPSTPTCSPCWRASPRATRRATS